MCAHRRLGSHAGTLRRRRGDGFRGFPLGPFHGRDAIAGAYRAQPPDDELRVLEHRDVEGRTEARHAWLAEPDVPAGELLLTAEDGLIKRLVITFDRGVSWN